MKQRNTFLIFIILLLGISSVCNSQSKYPQNYFQNPLDIPLVFSGNFGELRSTHFHYGIDLKTQQKEGLNVYASAEGSIVRIKVSHYGYGKALYIRHPNGYTSVYAHLKKFSPEIENYVKKLQYKNKTYEIQTYPKENVLKVAKGQIIGLSGNTGSSGGPHLHFEIRDTKTEHIINPLHFGITTPDHKAPVLQNLFLYPLTSNSQVNKSNLPVKLNIKTLRDGTKRTDTVTASGVLGLGIHMFDRQDRAQNKNGVYGIDLRLDGITFYQHEFNQYSFGESKYLYTTVDYKHFKKFKQRIHKCFKTEQNKIRNIYNKTDNQGKIYINTNEIITLSATLRDFQGNMTKVAIPIKGQNLEILKKPTETSSSYFINHTKFSTIKEGNVTVSFPKNSLYESAYLNFNQNQNKVTIHEDIIPLHKKITLTYDTALLDAKTRNKSYISRVEKNKARSAGTTKRNGNLLSVKLKKMGTFSLAQDYKAPTARTVNFIDGQNIKNLSKLQFKIEDKDSGISSYKLTSNGKWLLTEYEPKTATLFYSMKDNKLEKGNQLLKLIVTDKVGNKTTRVFNVTL